MLFLLSPAKTLDYETPAPDVAATRPHFVAEATTLIVVLRRYGRDDIAALMNLSDTLASLNVERYAAWRPRFTARNSKPALFAFNGDVYEGLDANSLDADALEWAQQHVVILSGLYGALRPLDRLQAYRLEMGTRLPTARGRDLYAFWGQTLSGYLRSRLGADAAPVVVNLASQEYFRAVDREHLGMRVVECVFEDWNRGRFRIISFHAKRACGLMVRYAVQQRALSPKALQDFAVEGYAFDGAASEPDRLVFRRRAPVSPP